MGCRVSDRSGIVDWGLEVQVRLHAMFMGAGPQWVHGYWKGGLNWYGDIPGVVHLIPWGGSSMLCGDTDRQ